MTRCGCTNYPICSCTVVGDGTTATVAGNGFAPSAWLVSVVGYPKPRPFGYVFRTTTLLTAGVDSTIIFAGNSSQPTTMWNVATPTRLTVPTTGTYLISAGAIHQCASFDGWLSSDSGQRRALIKVQKNGTTLLGARHNQFTIAASPVSTGAFTVTTVARLTAGDYVEMIVNLASMISALTTPSMSESFMSVRWMGL